LVSRPEGSGGSTPAPERPEEKVPPVRRNTTSGDQERGGQRPEGPDRHYDRGAQRPYGPSRYDDRGPQRSNDPNRNDSHGGQRSYDPNRYDSRGPQRPNDPNRYDSRGPQRPYDPNRHDDRGAQRPYDPNRYNDRGPQRPYDPNRYDDRSTQRPYDPRRDNSRGEPHGPSQRGSYPRSPQERDSYGGTRGPRTLKPFPGKHKKKASKPRPLGPGEMYAPPPHPEGIRINRYIANAGICSRRDADKLVESGEISINGVVVATLGYRIDPGDVVSYKGVQIKGEKLQYVLLNKPKGYITSNDDPEGRATVMELIEEACDERVFPVGRLDRNTTGLILFTNDGIMAEKLMHPRNLVKKLYHIRLDKPLEQEHMRKITMGIKLEDGWIKADQISYVSTSDDRTELGMEIHSGKNRIVRRIFEYLGYEVIKLDRVMFAGLTKKDLRRGKWRHLTPEELNFLKML
jgi:23S rRNA pseudouridine2605 synthase